jgi:nucleoside-diphosphate-sugar epimerase
VDLIRRVPDEATMRMVASWPGRFDARRARELGFEAETDFDEIVRTHVDDELHGVVGAVAA